MIGIKTGGGKCTQAFCNKLYARADAWLVSLFSIDCSGCEWGQKGAARHLLLIKVTYAFLSFNPPCMLYFAVSALYYPVYSSDNSMKWRCYNYSHFAGEIEARRSYFLPLLLTAEPGFKQVLRSCPDGCSSSAGSGWCVCTDWWANGRPWDQQSQSSVSWSWMPRSALIVTHHGCLHVSVSPRPLCLPLTFSQSR